MIDKLTAPHTVLGLITVVIVASHVSYWVLRSNRSPEKPLFTDVRFLAGVALTAVAIGVTYTGFFDTFMRVLNPMTDVLVEHVGYSDRFCSTYEGNKTCATRVSPSDILRVLIVIPVFAYAAYRDIKERIVRDWVWFPMFIGGLLLLVYDFWTGSVSTLAPWVLANLVFAFVIGIILYKTHLFGGADMKAILGLGLCLPTYPALIVFPQVLPPVLPAPQNAANLFALTILANTALVAAVYPLYTLARNVRDGDTDSPGLMLTARRAPLEESIDGHGKVLPLWSFRKEDATPVGRFVALIKSVMFGIDTQFVQEYLEWHNGITEDEDITDPADLDNVYIERFLDSDANTDADGERKWNTGDVEQAQEAMDELVTQDEVWMTPGIPFIVPMAIGLLISLTFGDIMYWLVLALN